jgi:myo-inositol catabolism protein IolC
VVLRAIQRLYNLGIRPEWWKLAPMSEAGWDALALLIAARDPWCRGAVILGLNQPIEALAESFVKASNSIVKGFMVGAACGPSPRRAGCAGSAPTRNWWTRWRQFPTLSQRLGDTSPACDDPA